MVTSVGYHGDSVTMVTSVGNPPRRTRAGHSRITENHGNVLGVYTYDIASNCNFTVKLHTIYQDGRVSS